VRVNLATLATVGAAQRMEHATEEHYRQVLALLRQYPHLTVDWASSYHLGPRCPSGKEKIAITCHGEVMGCSLNHISFGNVREEPLQAIWERAGRFSQFSKNSARCLAGFDRHHFDTYLAPMADLEARPVPYRQHPSINEESEPGLFSG
jgi:MoaA/NifB/PqqE/SkfB family radical SAM enzyme